ncbi:MAG: hypothetical protein K2M93_00305 [Muribaculaceae bacterium]|nr:hypothetical protein [Muribaculaceae bacterium]
MKNLAIFTLLSLGLSCAAQNNPGSLVPTTPSEAPDYYCTWNLQGFVAGHTFGAGSNDFRAEMNEDNLFGTHKVYEENKSKNIDGAEYMVDSRYQGWLDHFPSIRQDLLFVMDDSWDIPFDSNSKRPHGHNYDNEYLATLTIDPTRFPSFDGKDTERMTKLTDAVKGKGWKGFGGWICAQNPICLTKKYTGKQNTFENSKNWSLKQEEKYWKRRLKESQDAGFLYWKVDWGNNDRNDEFRRRLSQWGREVAPDVVIEHASFQDGGPHKPYYITFSEVLRTYDVRPDLSQAQTISRVAEVLGKGKAERKNWGIINCEDEAYIAAGLGCAIGIMRHPYVGLLPNGKPDEVFEAGNRKMKNRLNEIVRAVRWHRIATPFSADGQYNVSEEMLFDSGTKNRWEAPARVSRRMPLPEITGIDSLNPEKPYVLASLYDNECTAIAIINRLIDGDYKQHKVDVKVQPKRWDRKVGVFGHCHSLTLDYQNGLPEGPFKVFAQDLASDDAPIEIPYLKTDSGRGIIISGSTIEDLCRNNNYSYSEVSHIDADYTDLSDPGIVLLVVADE